jgi:hypothetical protein
MSDLNNKVNELVEKLVQEVGITPEQAQKTLETLAEYVKDKYPMLGGMVKNLFK